MTNKIFSASGMVAAILMLVGMPAAAPAAQCSLEVLGWMRGDWHNVSEPTRAQERWVVAPNDILMGSAWEFPEGKSGYAEAMTIRPEGDGIAMILRHFDGGLKKAWEERDAPMIFLAANCEGSSVTFDGQGKNVGERIVYTRSGNNLSIVADFLHQGKPDHEEWKMVRAGD